MQDVVIQGAHLGSLGLADFICGRSKHIRPQELKELSPSLRNSTATPFTHRRLPYLANTSYFGGTTKGIDDLGVWVLVFVHTPTIGLPILPVNRQPYNGRP